MFSYYRITAQNRVDLFNRFNLAREAREILKKVKSRTSRQYFFEKSVIKSMITEAQQNPSQNIIPK